MKIAVIGTGYVGLVTATCLAEGGNELIGVDKDASKIKVLEDGRLPIYEPGLLELVQRNRREQRLTFKTDLAAAPPTRTARSSLVAVEHAADRLARAADLPRASWAVGDALAACTVRDRRGRQLHQVHGGRSGPTASSPTRWRPRGGRSTSPAIPSS